MQRDYWDLDDILAESSTIRATVAPGRTLYHANHLVEGEGNEGGNGNTNLLLKEKTKLSLPLWLATRMNQFKASSSTGSGGKSASRKLIKMDLPSPIYCSDLLFALKQDASSVNLRQHSKYYFENAVKEAFLWLRSGGNSEKGGPDSLTEKEVKQGKLLLHYIERAAQCRWSDMVEHLGWGSLTLAPAPLYVQKLSGWEEQVFFEIKEMERTIMKRSWRILDESNEVDVAKRRKLG